MFPEDQPPTGGLFFSKNTNTLINEHFKLLKVYKPLKTGRGKGERGTQIKGCCDYYNKTLSGLEVTRLTPSETLP